MMKKILFLLLISLFYNVSNAQQMENPIQYVHPGSTSFKARLAIFFLSLQSKKGIEKSFKENSFNSAPAKIPKKYFDEFLVDTIQVSGRNVYTLAAKEKKSDKYILYIHGGAYVGNILKNHWDLIGELIRSTNATIIVPDYPLAPAHTVQDAFPMMVEVYKHVLTLTAPNNIIFMGDSAGGGFAIALAQKSKKDALPQPSQIILISPWLDITTANPDMVALEKKDPMLDIHDVQLAGKAYAGILDTRNYLVSPMYGELSGLAKISLFIGGRDILFADAEKFKGMMQEKGVAMNYFEYPKMFHVWVAGTFLKEAKIAIGQIAGLINK